MSLLGARISTLSVCALFPFSLSHAVCSIERTTNDSESYTRHLKNDCSSQERDTYAIRAEELFEALKNGRNIDLAGVVIVGDLLLDQLGLEPVMASELPSPTIQEIVRTQRLTALRQIAGSISIKNSVVRGIISTGLKEGFLLAKGPITITGTTFERPIDLSRTLFLKSVDFSDAVLWREGFFIRTVFAQPARFDRTVFGPHSRFHRAAFENRTTFVRATFNGLAEFLEVSFEKETNFSQTTFQMGAGFSGSHFGGALDFSDALFKREIYFLFTIFENAASFSRSTFHGRADFSDAHFKGLDDFSKTFFRTEPAFTRTKFTGKPPSIETGRRHNSYYLYGMAAVLTVFGVVLTLILKNRQPLRNI